MPNDSFHITKAEHNEDFYNNSSLANSKFNDWAATVLFYIAMHYVDAVLSRDSTLPTYFRNPRNHEQRKQAVTRCSRTVGIHRRFMILIDRSWEARYHIVCFPDGYLTNLERNSFVPARNHLRRKLGLPASAWR